MKQKEALQILEKMISGLSLEQAREIIKTIILNEPKISKKLFNLVKYSENRGDLNCMPNGDKELSRIDTEYNGDNIERSYGKRRYNYYL